MHRLNLGRASAKSGPAWIPAMGVTRLAALRQAVADRVA